MATLLLVDDHPAHRLALECSLEPLGHALVIAVSGQAALDMLEAVQADIVITDLWMVGMSGADLAEAIAAKPTGSRLPILLLTGADADDPEVKRAMRVATVAFVPKPYSAAALRQQVTRLLAAGTRAPVPRASLPRSTAHADARCGSSPHSECGTLRLCVVATSSTRRAKRSPPRSARTTRPPARGLRTTSRRDSA